METSLHEPEKDLIVCFGEMLVNFVPTVGGSSSASAPTIKDVTGGAPVNVAVGIARLGGQAAFIGTVGDDQCGHMFQDTLRENGVDVEGTRLDLSAGTTLAFVILLKHREHESMSYRNPTADMLLQVSEDMFLITKASIFHYGSISLIEKPCRSAHLAAMKAAKQAGALLSYDPNLRLPLWQCPEEARHRIFSIWNEADVIKVSDEEALFLTDHSGNNEDMDYIAAELWHSNLKLLLITEGAKGCRYYTEEFKGKVEAFKVDAVDTTGGGDGFVAGLLTQLIASKSLYQDEGRLREALKFANACGAITTTERGGISALLDKERALKLITRG